LKKPFPPTDIIWDCVGLIVNEEAPVTEKLLTARPLLLEMSKNIS